MEIRHKIELHQMTGRVAECPVDEMNRPREAGRAALRIPPSAVQVAALFAGCAGGAGHMPEVRSGGAQLCGGPADG
jgi:hypothetical protein